MAEAQRNRLAVALDPRVPIYRDTYNEYFVLVLSPAAQPPGREVPLYIVMAITGIWSVGIFVAACVVFELVVIFGGSGPAADAASGTRGLGRPVGGDHGDPRARLLLPRSATDALTQENLEKARDFIEAYNGRDFDRATANFDPDIDWVLPEHQASDSARGIPGVSASSRASTRPWRS